MVADAGVAEEVDANGIRKTRLAATALRLGGTDEARCGTPPFPVPPGLDSGRPRSASSRVCLSRFVIRSSPRVAKKPSSTASS